jgi:hypothetical protein
MARKFRLPFSALLGIAMSMAVGPTAAQPARDIVVFDFEMMDSSDGAGIIPADELDARYLAEATEVAKNYLRSQGAYTIVDAGPASADIAKAGGVLDCNGCEAKIASKLGGQLAMTGIVNRISRTEYEMLIKVVDAGTGMNVAGGYTGLRMGANYSWPRGAKWLMERRVMDGLSGK